MKVLCVYYSRTGTTRAAVQTVGAALRALGEEVTEEVIEPEVDLPFPLWLAQSFFPGSRAPISCGCSDPAGFDACLLGVPKWTFSCPPINTFLEEYGRRLPPTAVLVTCGGWDEARYLEDLEARLGRLGVSVVAGFALRRRDVGTPEAEQRLHRLAARLRAVGSRG